VPLKIVRLECWSWQREKASRLNEHIAQAVKPPVQGDEIEQITMLAGGGVGLMCS